MCPAGSRLTAVAGVLALLAGGCDGSDSSSPAMNPQSGSPRPGETNPDAGAAGAPAGTAVAKFCNGLSSQTGPIELALDVGNPPVRFVALTGECAPQPGQPCLAIADGPEVPVDLYLNRVRIGQLSVEVSAGQEIVFRPALVMQNNTQGLRLERSVQPPGACAGIDR